MKYKYIKLTIYFLAFGLLGLALAETPDPLITLSSDSIYYMAARESELYVATGQRLLYSPDNGVNWEVHDPLTGFGNGYVSALLLNDSAFWAATYYDTVVNNVTYSTLDAIYKTYPGEPSWNRIDVDNAGEPSIIIYDIYIDDSIIWTACWWKSILKSTDGGQDWISLIPDTTYSDPWTNPHHRVYSVLAFGDTICVGTEGGISITEDAGSSWTRIDYLSMQGPPANKVIILKQFPDTPGTIWAACRSTFNPGEVPGLAISEDGGFTWRNELNDHKIRDIFFYNTDAIVAADSDLYYSSDQGNSFYNMAAGQIPGQPEIYCTTVSAGEKIWAGTADGLYYTLDFGKNWQAIDNIPSDVDDITVNIPRDFDLGKNYPNPFNPLTTIPLRLGRNSTITLDILDILGRRVKRVYSGSLNVGDHKFIWDGTDEADRKLSSGVYLYRLQTDFGTSAGRMILLK